jgi:probable phosphoglycerate mutase
MKLPQIFLLRHGQTRWNAEGRFQGQMNSDLTHLGQDHAATQGRLLSSVFQDFPDIDVYGSPLGRVQQTAQIALADHGRAPIIRDDLKEIAAGDWEGITKLDIEKGWPDIFNMCQTSIEMFMHAPNGEGSAMLHDRCRRFLNSLESPSVVFSHGTTIAVLRGIARGLTFEQMVQLDHQQGCIYVIENGRETVISEV